MSGCDLTRAFCNKSDMMNYFQIPVLFLLLSAFLLSCSNTDDSSSQFSFDLRELAKQNAGPGLSFSEQDAALRFQPDSADHALLLDTGGIHWTKAAYLVMEVEHNAPYSAILYIDFYRRGTQGQAIVQQGEQHSAHQPRISPKIGVLPHLPTQVIFPLSHLDGQDIFLDRFPRQLKGTVLGSRLAPEDISRVALRSAPFQEPGFRPSVTIRSLRLTEKLPEALPPPSGPVVDSFGQWTARDWPGKVTQGSALSSTMRELYQAARQADYPAQWSRYGGWKARQFDATGFFRTHHDGRRWWLVDPEGYAFLSMGMDCVRPHAEGVLSDQEDLFAWLPPREDTLMAEAYSESRGMDVVDFYKSNLIRTFGERWRGNWDTLTAGLLRDMRFNTVGNWSDIDFARNARMPYVLPLGNFPETKVFLYRDFPDVYSEEYQKNAGHYEAQLVAYRDDPYLIGYFLRNEPHWAFGYHNLAFEMFATPDSSATRRAFTEWISKQYEGKISALNEAWQMDLPAFQAFDTLTLQDMPGGRAEADFRTFSEKMVARYVDVVCDAVERIDPNHLNLGMRYAWISSDLLYKAGERFDVFSINGYSFPGPPATEEIARRSGKPVLIGEYHFGAIDAGLPSTGIQGVATQEDRGIAYRYYTEQGFARPEVIALHYFQWNDQPVFGRFDGENYNIGFLDICLRPYAPLRRAARRTHERIYEVAAGSAAPFEEKAKRIPQIFF